MNQSDGEAKTDTNEAPPVLQEENPEDGIALSQTQDATKELENSMEGTRTATITASSDLFETPPVLEEEETKATNADPLVTPDENQDSNAFSFSAEDQAAAGISGVDSPHSSTKPEDESNIQENPEDATQELAHSMAGTQTATITASSDLFDRDTESEEKGEEDQRICVGIICWLCILIICCVLGAWWYNRSYNSLKRNDFSGNPNYPECKEESFNKHILPMIQLGTSQRMKKQMEDWKMRFDQYDMSVDPANVENVLVHTKDLTKELVLIYGAIKEHTGTVQLFDAVDQRLRSIRNEKHPGLKGKGAKGNARTTTTWIYDLMDMKSHNGTVHERIMCLFDRADYWSKKHPEERLLVVLDHISQPNGKANSIAIWNHLNEIKKWKKRKQWTLFVVESDPKKGMTVDGINWGNRVFDSKKKEVTTVSIPFIGSVLFEGIMRSLTESNPDIITMGYGKGVKGQKSTSKNTGSDTEKWMKLRTITRGFTVVDAYDIFHNSIRTKAKGLNQQKGAPVVLQMDDVLRLAVDQMKHNQFESAMVDRMDVFAKSVGQTVYYSNYTMDFGNKYYGATFVPKDETGIKSKGRKGAGKGAGKKGESVRREKKAPAAGDNPKKTQG